MSWLDNLKELNEVNLADLDLENVGSWPAAARGLLIVLLFIALLAGGYYAFLRRGIFLHHRVMSLWRFFTPRTRRRPPRGR